MILGESNKNDDDLDNMLLSLKDELLLDNEDLTFSDEESETSPKKSNSLEINSIPAIKLTPGMLIDNNLLGLFFFKLYNFNV